MKKYIKPKIIKKDLPINFLDQHLKDPTSTLLSYCDLSVCIYGCSWTCFLAGTLISMTDGSQKQIDHIIKGEEVVSFNRSKGALATSRVKETIHSTEQTYITINGSLSVTPFHRFWVVSKGWVQARKLQKGMILQTIHKKRFEVECIEIVQKKVAVYNLSLYGSFKNYFANECLVHNIKCLN